MKNKLIIFSLIIIDVMLTLWLLTYGHTIALFSPKGIIALQERNLIVTAILLMLLIVIPVFIMTFYIAWKYRAGNSKAAQYTPDWTGTTRMKLIWWAIPTLVVFVLAIITWNGAHELDPYKPIASSMKPLTIQVVALEWKWLFIYPQQHIATVNFIEFPSQTPINFILTADAPMNSFWIPQLGGQMYAMAGMQNQLHLMADNPGDFAGSAVEINGPGFAGMRFTARASSSADFDAWVQHIQHSSSPLTLTAYNKLAKPSDYTPTMFYTLSEKNLYNEIIMKYMAPTTKIHSMN